MFCDLLAQASLNLERNVPDRRRVEPPAEVLAENKQLKAETGAFVRILNVLEMENDQLKGKHGRTGTVIPIVGPR